MKIKAKDIDKKFDKGEDISKYLDLSKAKRPLRLTEKGKKKEAEAGRQIKEGKVKRFESVEELPKDLNDDL